MQPPFLRFEQLLLPPPLAALSGLLLAAGIAWLGIAGARASRGSRFEAIDGAAGMVVAAAALGAVLHGLALLGLLRLLPLRILAGSLAAVGLIVVVRSAPVLMRNAGQLRERWRGWPVLDRALAILLCVLAVGLLLAALGPACDADSLDYHLGVPLDWLRHGGAYPRPDWFTARLAGVGEMLNLLGLAGGTDCLGAILQAEGAAIAALAVGTFAVRDRDRLLAAAMVIAAPVLLSLVPAQKPQLFPVAATTVGLVLVVRRWGSLDRVTLMLVFACAAFAMSCKYPFLLSGGVVVAMGLLAARRSHLGFALVSACLALMLFAAPVYLRNWIFCGDPLSPFLEAWKAAPDPSVLAFAADLREYGGPRDSTGILGLAARALGARPITGIIGIAVLSPLLVNLRDTRARKLLGAAAVVAALELFLGQITPRFFLEPCLWSVAAIGMRERPIPAIWPAAASVQALGTACGAAYCAWLLFPGSWSAHSRDRLLARVAPGYVESRWLDGVLRPDDVLLTAIRSDVFLPRPFVSEDSFDGLRPPEAEQMQLRALERDAGVSVMTYTSDDELSPAMEAEVDAGEEIAPGITVREVMRNPWMPQPEVQLHAVRLRR